MRAAATDVVFKAANVIQIRNENNDARQRDHKTLELCCRQREVIPYRQLRSQIVCYRIKIAQIKRFPLSGLALNSGGRSLARNSCRYENTLETNGSRMIALPTRMKKKNMAVILFSARHSTCRMRKLIGCPHTGEITSSVYFSICFSFAISANM